MTDERAEPLYVKLPPELKYLVDEDDRTNKDVVIAALERELDISLEESEAVIRRKIRRKERRFQEARDQRDELDDHLRHVKSDLEQLRSILAEKESENEEYYERLDEFLDALEDPENNLNHVFPESAEVADVAKDFGLTGDEVVFDLKQQAVEQGRELLNQNFVEYAAAKSMEPKPIEESFDGGALGE